MTKFVQVLIIMESIRKYYLVSKKRNRFIYTTSLVFFSLYLICPNHHALETGGRNRMMKILPTPKQTGKTFNRSSNQESQHLGFHCYCQSSRKKLTRNKQDRFWEN